MTHAFSRVARSRIFLSTLSNQLFGAAFAKTKVPFVKENAIGTSKDIEINSTRFDVEVDLFVISFDLNMDVL